MPAGDHVASFILGKNGVMGHGRLADALGVRLALAGRRAARAADPVGESLGRGGFDRTARTRVGASSREGIERCEDHHPGLVDALHAELGEMAVEPGRLRERRDAHERAKPGRRKERQAEGELGVDAESAWRDRLDAARALGLAGREAQQPAVDPALLARRAGVDPGVLDAGEQRLVEARPAVATAAVLKRPARRAARRRAPPSRARSRRRRARLWRPDRRRLPATRSWAPRRGGRCAGSRCRRPCRRNAP